MTLDWSFRFAGVVAVSILCGCAAIQDAGNYLGSAVGIVPGKESYTAEEQSKQATTLISPEQEYHIGRAVAARILARFKAVNDSGAQEYIQLVGAALTTSELAKETFGGYHFIVIESDNLNAISAPGGYVFITSGFLKKLASEDQLAGILAHEIGHVGGRHGIKMLQQTEDFSQLSSLGLAAGGLNCVEALAQATLIFSQLVDNLIDTLLKSGYSQDLEFEADQSAAELLRATGYSPAGLAGALHALDAVMPRGSEGGGWLDTHPALSDRLEKLGLKDRAADPDGLEMIRLERFRAAMKSFR